MNLGLSLLMRCSHGYPSDCIYIFRDGCLEKASCAFSVHALQRGMESWSFTGTKLALDTITAKDAALNLPSFTPQHCSLPCAGTSMRVTTRAPGYSLKPTQGEEGRSAVNQIFCPSALLHLCSCLYGKGWEQTSRPEEEGGHCSFTAVLAFLCL